ncbi:MAG: fused MFS/spermidine synthase [Geobacteraceae bacterium]|nr:fused MFS/spermidine synthase [Geobacteraceae bacterium]
MAAYALTIFLGSFLLFQIQPLIGKYILPWYGGSPAVWTTCMLFFQVVLLAGYGYAHLATLAGRTRQGYLHLGMLLAALPFLPITPSAELWKPAPGDAPVAKILLLLMANIGMPYLVLAATAPLIQHWFVSSFPGRPPYRLYALSNFASLLALLSYPFLVEPRLTLDRQVLLWSWGFAVYALCCAWCAVQPRLAGRIAGNGPAPDAAATCAGDPPLAGKGELSVSAALVWLLLSASGSALLLATTNQLCQEVAVVPFLWVIPLAIYLLTFIICFNSDNSYDRVLWGMVLIGAVILACRTLYLGINVNLWLQILVFLAALFALCMVCHGELVRSRPAPRHLTAYYLVIAAGGAMGGALVALAAPALFDGFWEYPISLACSCLVILAAWFRERAFARTPRWLPAFLVAGQLALVCFVVNYLRSYSQQAESRTRNFYGVLRVIRNSDATGPKLTLMHGRVVHGTQFTSAAQRSLPTTYYGPDSAAGLALRFHPNRTSDGPRQKGLKVGVVGLGTGTLAAYGQEGDTFRFYEINPDVVRVAEKHFTYLKGSAARVEVAPGDARITMESELKRNSPQGYDVLLVDAFSSDAIPLHLLTRECFSVYRRHLKADGLLLVHITNRFLDLGNIVHAQGEAAGYRAARVVSPGDEKHGTGKADWMILTSNSGFLDLLRIRAKLAPLPATTSATPLWSDDFASLWQAMRR